jgi:hypothetical protein
MQLNCPRCQQENEFPESLAGSEARCLACGGLISVPVPEGFSLPSAGEAAESQAPEDASVFARLDGAQVTDSEVIDPSRVAAARPRPLWTKLVLVGLPLLLLLGGVGGYLAVLLERQSYAKQVEQGFKGAEVFYQEGKFDECEKALTAAQGLLDARPETVPVGADLLRNRAKALRSNIGKWRDAREIMNQVSIKPASTRQRIADLFKVVSAMGSDAAPVARSIEEMGRQAYGHELADRRKSLEHHIKGLQGQLDAGEFLSVREALKLAREGIAKAPGKMSGELAKVFAAKLDAVDAGLKQYVEIDKLVKAAPRGGPGREVVKAGILKRREALIAGGIAAKGFARQFEKWLAELRADRRELPTPRRVNSFLLKEIATDFAAAAPGIKLVENSLDDQRALFRLSSKDHHYRIQLCSIGGKGQFMIEVDGIRLSFPMPRNSKVRPKLVAYEMAQAQALAAALKASGHEAAWSKTPWQVYLSGPLQGAEPTAVLRGKSLVCTAGRVWKVATRQTQVPLTEASRNFIQATRELEEAVKSDRGASKDLREILGLMVKAAYQPRKSAGDFLPRQFCSAALARGYLGKNAPGLAVRIRSKLAAYKLAYARLARFIPGLVGQTAAGDEIEWGLNADGRTLWRFYDKKVGATTFALGHNDAQYRTRFFVHTTFAGKHAKWPAVLPLKVRMVHQAVGEVASWDPGTDKLVFDAKKWNRGTELEQFHKPPAHFGAPYWRFPPHVLLTDSVGNALGLVTPNGRLDMPEFGKRSGKARRKAQDAFISRCAKTLRTAGELHLLFRYFVKYTYDSPLTEYPFLIGDKSHTGDVHQDAYQTLDRKVAGRFIADCDDLAEFYQAVTRRQGRLSFVLGRPSHAICGFVEKQKNKYVFTAVDTGPPRQFRAAGLDAVVEAAFATFDEERTEAFDANSICFLLRFAGEQTRTPYYLGTRMFLDPAYARTMIRVQRDWHFAYIASGKETMVEMIKREKDPPTIFELAAFYRELGEWPQAIDWTRKGIAALAPGDTIGRLTENRRLAIYLERSGEKKAAAGLLRRTARGIEKAEAAAGAKAQRFAGLRLNLASDLDALGLPFVAWQTAQPAVRALERRRKLGGHNVTRLATILLSMRDLERGGRKLTDAEKAAAKELENLLARHFATRHFKERDTFRAHMDKYSDLAIFFAAKHGRKYALEKLLAPGPYPQAGRAHHRRGRNAAETEAQDWKWIRISMHAYNHFFQDALDGRKPVKQRRPAEAVKVLAALEKAIPEIRKRGSLGGMEFVLMGLRVRRDAITKNWSGMEATFKQTRKRNWGRLYRLIGMSLGDAASYMTADEFEVQFKKFCAQQPPLPHYYRVVYEALSNKRYEHALRAARITAERFPHNAAVQREFKLFQELLKKRPRDGEDKDGEKTGERAAPVSRLAA